MEPLLIEPSPFMEPLPFMEPPFNRTFTLYGPPLLLIEPSPFMEPLPFMEPTLIEKTLEMNYYFKKNFSK